MKIDNHFFELNWNFWDIIGKKTIQDVIYLLEFKWSY